MINILKIEMTLISMLPIIKRFLQIKYKVAYSINFLAGINGI